MNSQYTEHSTLTNRVIRHEKDGDILVHETRSREVFSNGQPDREIHQILKIDKANNSVVREVSGFSKIPIPAIWIEPYDYYFGHCMTKGEPVKFEIFTQLLGSAKNLIVERKFPGQRTSELEQDQESFIVSESTFMVGGNGKLKFIAQQRRVFRLSDPEYVFSVH